MAWEYPLVVLISYLVGAFPSGWIVGKLSRGIDVRDYGSGASGATNILRTLGREAFLVVLLVDVLKGYLTVLVVWYIFESHNLQVASGLAAIIGHDWPVYIGFRGGRGVATAFGVYAAMLLPLAFGLLAVALFIILAFRYMSLMSIVTVPLGAIALLALAIAGLEPYAKVVFGALTSALVLLRHAGNIQRLLRGAEPRIGERGERRALPGPRQAGGGARLSRGVK